MNLQKLLRSISIIGLFLIPIFPLIVVDSFFFPFITGKAFYFRILVEVAFASWAILAFLDAKYRPKFTPLTIGVSIFALVALVADLLGVNPLRSIWSNFERMEGWLVIAHLWMFYMTATHTFGAREDSKLIWHRWFNVSLVVALITAIYGLVQLSGHAAIHQGSVRLDASLGNAAYLAVYMLIHTGIAAYMFLIAQGKKIMNSDFLVWAYPVLAVLFGFIVFETQTRGTILGLIGGTLLALGLHAIFGKNEVKGSAKESNKWRIISASILGAIVLLGVIFWMNRDASFIQKSPTLSRIASISWNENKTQARGYIWPMAVKGALERPLFGWGQENFNYIFNANYEPRMYAQEQWFDRAHSVFLDWLVASGFVGLVAYLALYVLLIVAFWRKSGLSVAEKSVLTGLIAGYAVHNIFVFDNLASYTFFFALLGFGGSLVLTTKSSTKKASKDFSLDAVEYVVAPIVIVLLMGGLYFLNIRPIQANTSLIAALTSCSDRTGKADPKLFTHVLDIDSYMANQETREQIIACTGGIINSNSPGPVKQAYFVLAQEEIKAQIAATPGDARIYVLGGSFMSALGQNDEATKLLEKAHELTPNKQSVAIQLASIYIGNNKKDEAIVLLKNAYESDHGYTEAKNAYVMGLILAGKEAEAQKIFVDSPEVFQTDQIARAYTSVKQYTKAIAIYTKLISADPKNVQLRGQLSQAQYESGNKWAAIETLKAIAKDSPEYKTQVDAAIKQIEAGK